MPVGVNSFCHQKSAFVGIYKYRIMAKEYTIHKIEQMIKRAMNAQGTYSKSLDITISLASGSLFAFYKAAQELESGDLVVTETSREGNERKVCSPYYIIMHNSAEQARKYMRELRLTRATIEGDAEEDELTELVSKVNSIKTEKSVTIKKAKLQDNG